MRQLFKNQKEDIQKVKEESIITGHSWTAEQNEAINARNCNLLVAAAAGAGKTAVLVERIIKKITDKTNPIDIDRMLIVTFTNAAAAEMRERIGEAISKELDTNPESESIRRQLSLLSRASITTIHSFCKGVIRKNIQSIELDPNFRIADDTETTLMRIEALNEVINEQYEQERQDFLQLLDWYGGNRDDQIIQDIIISLYNFIQSSPWPEQWLKEKTEILNMKDDSDFSKTIWGEFIIKSCRLELTGIKNILEDALKILKYAEGLEKYIPVFEEDLDNVEKLNEIVSAALSVKDTKERGTTWDEIFDMVHEIKFSRLPRAGKNADKEKQAVVKSIRDTVKETVSKRIPERLITAKQSDIIKDFKALYPVMLCLARLIGEFTARYKEKKSRRTVIDFNDLEHMCLKILTQIEGEKIIPSRAAVEYREYFDEIMVDEYQDSNLVQEIIIKMISRSEPGIPNVFMVGDVKQSIYRFRQAKPELFLEKYNTYTTNKGDLYRKVLLYKNFRSRREIIDAVNFVFGRIMSVDAGELDYTEKEALNAGAEYVDCTSANTKVGGEVELHLVQTGRDVNTISGEDTNTDDGDNSAEIENNSENAEIIDNIQCEARIVAKKILEITGSDKGGAYFHVFDKRKKEYRQVEYKDIVILLRTTKNWSDVFLEELAAKGIPAFADTGTGFFKTIEIQVVLSLLQIIDNPLQDIPLLSVLRSPMFSFTSNELAELRLADRKTSMFNALKALSQKDPVVNRTDINVSAVKKASMFIEKLSFWRNKSYHMSTDQLLWYLYHDTGYYDMVGAMPQGQQRQANLRILYDRARQFEETSYKGLFNFINFIDKLKSSIGDMGSAKILGENDNVVRIMSIHKSKGLEFPVVLLSGCGKRFNLMDANKSVLMHQELGLGPDVVDLSLRLSKPSVAKIAIREKIKMETLSEEMRILYVAMTRAREKLIITGAVPSIEKAVSKWMRIASGTGNKLACDEVLKSTSYLDWIAASLLRHKSEGREGKTLLDFAQVGSQFNGEKVEDPSRWALKVWDKNDFLRSTLTNDSNENELAHWLDKLTAHDEPCEYWDEVKKRLDWDYPFIKVNEVPAKITVTELKRQFDSELPEEAGRIPLQVPLLVKKPLFLEERKGLSAAEKGTILHFVMQHLDFENGDIKGQIELMLKKELLTEQQAQSVKTEKIKIFLNSALGKRMIASKSIQREVPFNIEIPCHELFLEMIEQKYRNETVLLQGIIDCYFEDPDGLVLIDYKTDYVPFGESNTIIERYRIQLDYYARTLSILTGKNVKEKYIYLFSTGEILEM